MAKPWSVPEIEKLSHAGALASALRAGDVGYVVGQCPTLVIVDGERGSRPGRVASPGA